MSSRTHLTYHHWDVVCDAADGARLTHLAWNGHPLLTPEPAGFQAPAGDFGLYETRPVYGYDDCFPTVDACPYPGQPWDVPDHGELCWRQWKLATEPDCLVCTVRSDRLPVTFTRRLRFAPHHLRWEFSAANHGSVDLPCLHVMHALMPLASLAGITLPACDRLYDEIAGATAAEPDAEALLNDAIARPPASPRMLILHGIHAGTATTAFRPGFSLRIDWDARLFPHLAIWWNPGAYPDEPGCRRSEFALEPLSGPLSSLACSAEAGQHLSIPVGATLFWQVEWVISP